MPEPSAATGRHPLLERLVRDFDIPEVDSGSVNAFLSAPGDAVLFFAENLVQYPESADVAVILPELVRVFGGRFRAALVSRASERELQKRFGFARWPALVFMRRGDLVGTITGVHDWDEFVSRVGALLAAPTRRAAAAAAARENVATDSPREPA